MSTIFFLAPTTTKARLSGILKASTGFIYFVSVAGVTGAKKAVASDIARQIRLARTMTTKPICVGFGVSTPDQVKAMGRIADGVIVGSAIVKEVERLTGQKNMPTRVAQFVRRLAEAL
jgi:tryptophan synthase alpha chain